MGTQHRPAIRHCAARRFINERLYSVPGYLHPTDAMMLVNLSICQHEQGWSGGLAEIGVYYGRLFSLLAHLASPERERLLGIDLFHHGEVPAEGRRQQEAVMATLARFKHDPTTYQLHAGSSLELRPEDITTAVGPVRLFSIDGGHELEHITHDSQLALATLAPFGILVFDDFMNAAYPDVSRGLFDFLKAQTPSWIPFAITRNKLYVCHLDYSDHYRLALQHSRFWGGAYTTDFKFSSQLVTFCQQSILHRAIFQKAAEWGLVHVVDRFLRPDLTPVYR